MTTAATNHLAGRGSSRNGGNAGILAGGVWASAHMWANGRGPGHRTGPLLSFSRTELEEPDAHHARLAACPQKSPKHASHRHTSPKFSFSRIAQVTAAISV